MKSIEEKIEDIVKKSLTIKYYCKTESINSEIDNALKSSLSKQNGIGGNYPDIKLLINNIPIMIEIKGKDTDFIKFDILKFNTLLMNNKTIPKYAINGAVHYANNIVSNSNYKKCIAIGITGNTTPTNDINILLGSYLIERDKSPIRLQTITKLEDLNKLSQITQNM